MDAGDAGIALALRLEVLAAELDALLSTQHWPAHEGFIHLQTVLSESAESARMHGLRGVPELLRLLQGGLEQCASAPAAVSDDERVRLVLWLLRLASFCSGQLDADECGALLDDLTTVAWMPSISPRIRDCILARLTQAAAARGASMAPLARQADPSAPDVPVREDAAWLPEPYDLVVTDEAADAIWIGAEEFELAASAFDGQLLPLTDQLSQCDNAEERHALLIELEFQTGLVANAFEVLGLPQLWQLTTQVQADLISMSESASPPGLDALMGWQLAMLGLLRNADAEAIEILCHSASALVGTFDVVALIDELGSIRIGRDPRVASARKYEVEPADVDLSIAADVLPEVLDGMLRELPRNALHLGEGVRAFLADPRSDGLAQARRYAHTLKGDANTVGVRGLANLTHALEDVLVGLARSPSALDGGSADLLNEAADCVEAIADHLLHRAPVPQELTTVYRRVLQASNALLDGASAAVELSLPEASHTSVLPGALAPLAPPFGVVSAPSPPQDEARAAPTMPAVTPANADAPAAHIVEASHAVPVPVLNELLRLAGESAVLMRQIEQRVKGLSDAYAELAEQSRVDRDLVSQLDDLVALRGAALRSTRLGDTPEAGGREVDPLELDQYTELHVVSRRMIERNSDQGAVMQRADTDLLTLSDLMSMQARTQADLQRLVMRTRTVPLSSVAGRLQRVVRQAARLVAKTVELRIEGADTPLDSELLDRIVEPLGHVLRNAVDHGIEDPPQRRQAGKPESGSILLQASVAGDAIRLVIADDGRGLDYDAIRRRAIEQGLLDAAAQPGEDALGRFILLPGFSTRSQATQVSGRGIGMDVVAQRVAQMRGDIALHSSPGQGMELRITLPASLTSANVILASDGNDRVAAVASSVRGIVPLDPRDFELGEDGRLRVVVEGRRFAALPLAAVFERRVHAWTVPDARRIGLLVDAPGLEPHVVYIERVDEVRNVIVKTLGERLAPIPALRGVTILGDGGVAPVLDLPQSLRELARDGSRLAFELHSPADDTPRIVVADDSLSVRRALAQLMQDAGYRVVTARDGVEALDSIRESAPAAALLDMEMPRLNGLDVARYLRNQSETATLPIVMVTSRATEKYRILAREAGVTHLVGKPFDEDELVMLVRRLTHPTEAMADIGAA